MTTALHHALDELPRDAFDLDLDTGVEVESLTAGHGITQANASSCCCVPPFCCSC